MFELKFKLPNFRQKYVIIFVFCLLPIFSTLTSQSVQAGEFSLLGGANFVLPASGNAQLGSRSNLGLGVGFQWEVHLYRRLSLETGALYLERNWTYSGAMSNSESVSMIEVPLLIRIPFLYVFSLGGGAYYGRYLGSIQDTSANGSTTTITQTSYGADSRSTSDYGLLGSLRFAMELDDSGQPKVFIDARYAYGLSDNALTGSSLKFSDMQILFGITFGVLKK